MATRLGYVLYAIASCIAVVVIAGGVVVWLYFAHPNKDPLGLVIVGWGIIFGLAVSVSAIGSLVDKTTRQQPSPIALVYCARRLIVFKIVFSQLGPSKKGAMSAKEKAQQSLTKLQREIFRGVHRHPPKTDGELQEWLSSPRGPSAIAFQPLSATRWGEGALVN